MQNKIGVYFSKTTRRSANLAPQIRPRALHMTLLESYRPPDMQGLVGLDLRGLVLLPFDELSYGAANDPG
jgi:hypothetical protein